jgi:asparagine synthase (glutamine-hydrolysing)
MGEGQRCLAPLVVGRDYGHWRSFRVHGAECLAAGDEAVVRAIAAVAPREFEQIVKLLEPTWSHFAGIISNEDGVVAFTDICRSYPVFYGITSNGRVVVGPRAESVLDALGEYVVDDNAVVEALATGYVTGSDTLFCGLHQLRAGEIMVATRGAPISIKRWFVYAPLSCGGDNSRQLKERLASVTDLAIQRLIERAADAPIMIPLSGGLDSRLILCKLHELGCRNLKTFSYGPPGNPDAETARQVATELNVPWVFIPNTWSSTRTFFMDETRSRYWKFAGQLSTVPNFQDVETLAKLDRDGLMAPDAILVNGQTGDFISGGHISPKLIETDSTSDDFFDALIKKHYSLWQSLLTEENLSLFRYRIAERLGLPSAQTEIPPCDMPGLYECWEYEERQAKYVIHGQRSYEFFGRRWHLPLWDGDFVRFWQTVPVSEKLGQKLFITWLNEWNYKGLFAGHGRGAGAWSRRNSLFLLPTSILVRLLIGREKRDKLFRYARYFDRFGNQYAAQGFRFFARHAQDIRNPVSLFVLTWLAESGLHEHFPKKMDRGWTLPGRRNFLKIMDSGKG